MKDNITTDSALPDLCGAPHKSGGKTGLYFIDSAPVKAKY